MVVNDTARVALVLEHCGLKVLPRNTILAFQNVDSPNKFSAVRFTPPGLQPHQSPNTFLWRGDLKEWVLVLCILTGKDEILRYGVFEFAKLGPSVQWTTDDRRLCASIPASVVSATLQPVGGCSGLIDDEPSLKEWMTKRARTTKEPT